MSNGRKKRNEKLKVNIFYCTTKWKCRTFIRTSPHHIILLVSKNAEILDPLSVKKSKVK